MSRPWSALRFALAGSGWTLALFLGFVLALRYSEAWRHPGAAWWSPAALWANLEAVWFLLLPLFPAALLGFALSERWGRLLTALLLPLCLSVWVWSPYRMPAQGLVGLTALVWGGLLCASLPGAVRSLGGRTSGARRVP